MIAAARRAAILVVMLGASARAQVAAPPAVVPELRVDAIIGAAPAVQLGLGTQLALGSYVRVGVDVAAGTRVDDITQRTDGRADVLVRFLLDPFRQSPYGLSIGGGLSVRAEHGDRARPLLLAAIDLEGQRWRSGWVPAVQVGVGGGLRLGLVLRHGAAQAR